jgi:hypothetical protein
MKPEILIQFDLSKVYLQDLFEIEKLFAKNGITFDTGTGFGKRDWQWDFSLEGPIEVTVNVKKGEKDVRKKTSTSSKSSKG